MKHTPIYTVGSALWSLLNPKERLAFGRHVVLLFISGLLDSLALLGMYGFIVGLRRDLETGMRGGRMGQLLHFLDIGPLSQKEYAAFLGAVVVFGLLLKHVLATVGQHRLDTFLMTVNHDACVTLLDHQLVTPYEEVGAQRFKSGSGQVSAAYSVFSDCFSGLVQVLLDLMTLTLGVVLLFLIQPVITLVALVEFGVVGRITYLAMRRRMAELGKEEFLERKVGEGLLKDSAVGLLDIRLRDARPALVSQYSESLRRLAQLQRKGRLIDRAPRSVNEILLVVTLVGGALYMSFTSLRLSQALPILGIFAFAGIRMTSAMSRVNQYLQLLKMRAERFEESMSLLRSVRARPELARSDKSYLREERPLPEGTDGKLHAELSVRKVSFTYSGAENPALVDVNLNIPHGSMVSICGPSGGGKSTLALILLGILQPESGEVRCDDWNIFHHIRDWHRNIGYVGPDLYLSARTVRENVAFAVPPDDIDDERVWRALRLASAESFVKKHRHGIHRYLHPGGTNMSSGQRQRMLIARAMYHDPELLVFDEATAALDGTTEREVTDAISSLRRTKTLVCIAHRLNTIQHSDRIYVVEDGRITGSGTFDELNESHATFQKLVINELSRRTG